MGRGFRDNSRWNGGGGSCGPNGCSSDQSQPMYDRGQQNVHYLVPQEIMYQGNQGNCSNGRCGQPIDASTLRQQFSGRPISFDGGSCGPNGCPQFQRVLYPQSDCANGSCGGYRVVQPGGYPQAINIPPVPYQGIISGQPIQSGIQFQSQEVQSNTVATPYSAINSNGVQEVQQQPVSASTIMGNDWKTKDYAASVKAAVDSLGVRGQTVSTQAEFNKAADAARKNNVPLICLNVSPEHAGSQQNLRDIEKVKGLDPKAIIAIIDTAKVDAKADKDFATTIDLEQINKTGLAGARVFVPGQGTEMRSLCSTYGVGDSLTADLNRGLVENRKFQELKEAEKGTIKSPTQDIQAVGSAEKKNDVSGAPRTLESNKETIKPGSSTTEPASDVEKLREAADRTRQEMEAQSKAKSRSIGGGNGDANKEHASSAKDKVDVAGTRPEFKDMLALRDMTNQSLSDGKHYVDKSLSKMKGYNEAYKAKALSDNRKELLTREDLKEDAKLSRNKAVEKYEAAIRESDKFTPEQLRKEAELTTRETEAAKKSFVDVAIRWNKLTNEERQQSANKELGEQYAKLYKQYEDPYRKHELVEDVIKDQWKSRLDAGLACGRLSKSLTNDLSGTAGESPTDREERKQLAEQSKKYLVEAVRKNPDLLSPAAITLPSSDTSAAVNPPNTTMTAALRSESKLAALMKKDFSEQDIADVIQAAKAQAPAAAVKPTETPVRVEPSQTEAQQRKEKELEKQVTRPVQAEYDAKNFYEALGAAYENGIRTVVIDFGAKNCGPCLALQPYMHTLASEMGGKGKEAIFVNATIADFNAGLGGILATYPEAAGYKQGGSFPEVVVGNIKKTTDGTYYLDNSTVRRHNGFPNPPVNAVAPAERERQQKIEIHKIKNMIQRVVPRNNASIDAAKQNKELLAALDLETDKLYV